MRVVSGGQAAIDQGHVVLLFGNLLAGHRTKAGGVFRNLPGINEGTELAWNGRVYVVTRKVVTTSRDAGQISGIPLVLQTSLSGGRLLLVHCRPG